MDNDKQIRKISKLSLEKINENSKLLQRGLRDLDVLSERENIRQKIEDTIKRYQKAKVEAREGEQLTDLVRKGLIRAQLKREEENKGEQASGWDDRDNLEAVFKELSDEEERINEANKKAPPNPFLIGIERLREFKNKIRDKLEKIR